MHTSSPFWHSEVVYNLQLNLFHRISLLLKQILILLLKSRHFGLKLWIHPNEIWSKWLNPNCEFWKLTFWPKMIQDYHQVYKKFPFPLSLLNKNIKRTFLCLPKNFVKLTWPDSYGFRHSFFVLGQESLAEILSRPAFFRQFDGISSLDMEFPPWAQIFWGV